MNTSSKMLDDFFFLEVFVEAVSCCAFLARQVCLCVLASRDVAPIVLMWVFWLCGGWVV